MQRGNTWANLCLIILLSVLYFRSMQQKQDKYFLNNMFPKDHIFFSPFTVGLDTVSFIIKQPRSIKYYREQHKIPTVCTYILGNVNLKLIC